MRQPRYRNGLWGAALSIFALASPLLATPITLDFRTGPLWDGSSANRGSSLSFSNLTITPVTGLVATDDPLFVSGKTGTIFWGKLGSLNASAVCGGNCIGLGVRAADGSGDKAIDGEGIGSFEALIFSWTGPLGVMADSIDLTLVGINNGNNADVVDLALEFFPFDNPSDRMVASVSFPLTNPQTFHFSSIAGISGNTLGAFAVEARGGHFGVGAISYSSASSNEVPEPATTALLAIGLIALGVRSRRRK